MPSHLSASSSQLNGTNGHLEPPQTYDAVVALNTSLKTRVSELEVINDLFRGRVTELERGERDARQAEEVKREEVEGLKQELEEIRQREKLLKEKLEESENLTKDSHFNRLGDMTEAEGKRVKRRRMNESGNDNSTSEG